MGSALYALGNYDEAVACFRKALSINPDFINALYNFGIVLQAQGELEKAAENYRKALALSPRFVHAHIGLAKVYIDLGQFEAAQATLLKVLELEHEYPAAWSMLPSLRKMTTEDSNWLDTALRLASRKNPVLSAQESIDLQFAIGKYYDDTGQYDLAFAAY